MIPLESGDNIVLLFIIFVILGYGTSYYISWKDTFRWLMNKPQEKEKIEGKIPKFLQEQGYECISEKGRVPIDINWGEKTYTTRIYTDFIARKDNKIYIVFLSRDRRPLKYSGPALKDFFLNHYLLYKPAGILYINRDQMKITEVTIDYEVEDYPEKFASFGNYKIINYILTGILIGFLMAGIIYNN